MTQKFFSKISLIGTLVLLLSSCISADITSNKSPDFTQKVKKVYFNTRTSSASKNFMLQTNAVLGRMLRAAGIECQFHYMDELALETEDDVIRKINDYKPEAYVIVNETERRTKIGNFGITTNTGSTLDLKLFLPSKQSPVWRAQLRADGGTGIEKASEEAAKYIYNKMKADGIF